MAASSHKHNSESLKAPQQILTAGLLCTATTFSEPAELVLRYTYLQVIHVVQAVLIPGAVPVGQELCIHHLPVSHHQHVHLLSLAQPMCHRVLPQRSPLLAPRHLHCAHTNINVLWAPFDACLAARASVPSSFWDVLGELLAIVPHPFTGADCLGGRLLGAGVLLPDAWLLQAQRSGKQLFWPGLKVFRAQLMFFGCRVIFLSLTTVVTGRF